MANLNRCSFIGNVGKIGQRSMNNGENLTSFSVAVNESWKDKSGNKKEKTEWVNLVAFGRLGEIAYEYLGKGSPVYVDSKVQTRKWVDKEGNDRYSTEFIVSGIQLLSSKSVSNSEQSKVSDPTETDEDIPF